MSRVRATEYVQGHQRALTGAVMFILIAAGAAIAPDQARGAELLGTSPWSFTATNRASLAVVMKQMSDAKSGSSLDTIGSGASATIVCGGGSATAAGTSNCIILNNSTGMITTDQTSTGNQDSTSTVDTTLNNTSPAAVTTDDVLNTLTGAVE